MRIKTLQKLHLRDCKLSYCLDYSLTSQWNTTSPLIIFSGFQINVFKLPGYLYFCKNNLNTCIFPSIWILASASMLHKRSFSSLACMSPHHCPKADTSQTSPNPTSNSQTWRLQTKQHSWQQPTRAVQEHHSQPWFCSRTLSRPGFKRRPVPV